VSSRAQSVHLKWVASDGTEHAYGEIAAGTRTSQRTYSGHTWVVDGGDAGVARYVASRHLVQSIEVADDLPVAPGPPLCAAESAEPHEAS